MFAKQYPTLSELTCDDCHRYVTSIPEGTFHYAENPDTGEKVRERRIRGSTMPCESCPKGGPENDEACRLSPANKKLVEAHRKYQAKKAYGAAPEITDPLIVDNFYIIDKLDRQWEKMERAKLIALELAPLIMARKVVGD